MKLLLIILLGVSISSCGRYLCHTTKDGVDYHVQKNHIHFIDSLGYHKVYVKDAYKRFNHLGDFINLTKNDTKTDTIGVNSDIVLHHNKR